jgi:hypothetical protein
MMPIRFSRHLKAQAGKLRLGRADHRIEAVVRGRLHQRVDVACLGGEGALDQCAAACRIVFVPDVYILCGNLGWIGWVCIGGHGKLRRKVG